MAVGSDSSLLERLKKRKLAQWALAYLAGAYVVYEASWTAAEAWDLSVVLVRAIHVILVCGLFITLVLAWYHGEKGRQRVTGPELVALAGLLVVAGVVLSLLDSGEVQTASSSFDASLLVEEGRPSIAVLPCSNESPDPDDEYLAAGLHGEVLVWLSKIGSLLPIGGTSARQLIAGTPGGPETTAELGVGFVGLCSVTKAADRIRLTFRVEDAGTGVQVWAEQYESDFDLTNLFDVYTRIAQRVARELGSALTPAEEAQLQARPTEHSDAYELYLRGRASLERWSPEGVALALEYFNRALEVDPDYVLAYAGLAEANAFGATEVGIIDWGEGVAAAVAAADRLRALDVAVGQAHTAIGIVSYWAQWRWAEAERQFSRAMDLSPNDPNLHHWFAHYLMTMGRVEAALDMARRGLALDPLSPTMHQQMGWNLFFAGRYDEAIAALEQTLELDPAQLNSAYLLAWAYLQADDPGRAIDHLSGQPDALRPYLDAVLACALSASGRAEEATPIPAALERQGLLVMAARAGVCTGESADETLRRLEEAAANRDVEILFLLRDPTFQQLHGHARFQQVLRSAGLAG